MRKHETREETISSVGRGLRQQVDSSEKERGMSTTEHTEPDTTRALVDEILADLPKLASVRETAACLGVSTSTLRRWIVQRNLAVVDTAPGISGGRLLLPRSEIFRLVREMIEAGRGK